MRNQTRDVVLGRAVEVADTSEKRRTGLLKHERLEPGSGLWIVPCESVHTFFMKFPIDLVYLDLGGTVVELITYDGATVDPAPQKEHLGYRMIAIEVDDMQQAADYLKTKGVDIVWGPRVAPTYARAEICDPNGYHIELRQWFR